MTEKYSPNESLERIAKALAGEANPSDLEGYLGQQSINESLAKIAQLLEGSSSDSIVIPGTVAHYGGMYARNVTGTVVVAATDTYYSVTGTNIFTAGNLNDFTVSTWKLTCGFAGYYLVTYSLSVYSASASQEIEATIMQNGSARSELTSHVELTSASKSHCLSGSAVLSLASGDILSFGVANHTGTNNLIVQHATLSVVYISSA